MGTRRFILLVLLTAALLTARPAAPLADEGGPEAAGSNVEVAFQGPLALEDFLRGLASALDLPLIWDPKSRAIQGKELQGQLTFRGTKEEVFEAARALLTFYEIVLIPVGGGANERILVMDARQTASIVKLKPVFVELDESTAERLAGKDGLFVTTTIRVANLDGLRDARNALSRLVTAQNIGSVQEVPGAQAFVVTDFAPNVVAIWRLLREMDAGGPPEAQTAFRAFALQHADAAEVAATLVQHFGANDPPPRNVPPQNPAAPDLSGTGQPLRIHADARTNQVLVTGRPGDLPRVAEVLAAIDRPLPGPGGRADEAAERVVEVLPLEHARAQLTAGVVQQLLNLVRARGGPPPELPAVVGDVQTNAVVLEGRPAALAALRRLIQQLDAPQRTGAPDLPADVDEAVLARLQKARVSLKTATEAQPLSTLLSELATAAGVPIVVTPLASQRMPEIRFAVQEMNALSVLKMLLNASQGLAWDTVDGQVVVKTVGETVR